MASKPTAVRRVVVTGMGLVTSLGVGVDHVWSKLVNGQTGITKLTGKGYETLPCRVAGLVPRGDDVGELNLEAHINAPELRTMSLASAYALVATKEAVRQSKLNPPTSDEESISRGVAVGMGMVGLDDIVETGRSLQEKGYRSISPHFVPRILTNMAAGHIALRYECKGPNHAVSTACTTGVHSIGDAYRFIKYGDADVMICGGTEACVSPVALAGFAKMRALSTKFNDTPHMASRPFDKDRDGFVMAEGAGILILEELSHAQSRGTRMYAEILGYGLSGDAHHITAPSADGDGAFRCMQNALKNGDLSTDCIGYINAHATSTPLGDKAESRAIQRLFKDNCKNISVSSTKGAVGHLLGAAGSVEAIFTVMAVNTGLMPPTVNLDQPDDSFDFNHIPNHAMDWTANDRIALTNSFGFGGTNASLCFGHVS